MSTSYFISAYATGKRSCFSVAKPCPTLCDPVDCSLPGFPVPHHLPEFTQTHVCWIGDAIQSSHLLPSSSLFAFNVSQHQSLSQSYLSLNASLCAVLSVCFVWFLQPHGPLLQAKILEWVAVCSFRGSSHPRNDTASPVSSALAERFFTTEPPGKPKMLHCHF